MHHTEYRSDIDGLRALAILPVILFHAGMPGFSGGFVGVDIFFVISGYLITSIIFRALNAGTFTIRGFYDRRMRRILPALYAVCFTSLVISLLLLLPADLEKFGESLLATLLFVSNIVFWADAGYFDAAAHTKPLLHTWSLAVEEQFYIGFPLFVMILWKVCRGAIRPALLCIFFISLVASIWGAVNMPSATFYLAPTRVWELLLGSLLALGILPQLRTQVAKNILGLAGLIMIAYAICAYDYATPFPGLAALLPCIGAALLIHSGGTGERGLFNNVLSYRPVVFIGLISYSLYLWHWPVFVFAQYASPAPLQQQSIFILITMTFALAILSWRYIERPFRSGDGAVKGRTALIWAVSSSAMLIAITSFVIFSKGLPQRFESADALPTYKSSHIDSSCADIPAAQFDEKKCILGAEHGDDYKFIVWGDSHAHALAPAASAAAKEAGARGFLSSRSGCPPLIGVREARSEKPELCPATNEHILSLIKPEMTVFLTARWPYYLEKHPSNKEGPVWLSDAKTRHISNAENTRVLEQGLRRTIDAIQKRGGAPVIVVSAPEYFRSIPDSYARFGEMPEMVSSEQKYRIQPSMDIITKVAAEAGIGVINPADILCVGGTCKTGENNKLFYFDDDHLSLDGAQKIMPLYRPYFGATRP